MQLDLLGLLEDRPGILVGRRRPVVGRGHLEVLRHDDDRAAAHQASRLTRASAANRNYSAATTFFSIARMRSSRALVAAS